MAKAQNLILLSLIQLLLLHFRPCNGECSSKPRSNGGFDGMFVFGDSIMDVGNNNIQHTPFKSNYFPYGVDFGSGSRPTGRFTNGKNLADHIGDVLRLPLVPAFSDPMAKGDAISGGVNFASAGSGILDETGSNLGVISLNQQINNFVEATLPNLEAQEQCSSEDLLQHYLFLFSAGANDLQINFFQGGCNNVTLELFTSKLASSIASQITRLFNLGARRFAFLEVGPLGCAPFARVTMPDKACNETLNYAAFLYNSKLVLALNSLQSQMPGFEFTVINFFHIFLEFVTNPSSGGFSEVISPCCEVEVQSGGILCRKGGRLCSERSKYMHFDGVHPTEPVYRILAARAFNSNSISEVYPVNLQRLTQLSA